MNNIIGDIYGCRLKISILLYKKEKVRNKIEAESYNKFFFVQNAKQSHDQ